MRVATTAAGSWRPGQAHPHHRVNTRPGMFLAGSQLRLTSATTTLIEFYCYLLWQRPVINENQPTWTLTELLILLYYLVTLIHRCFFFQRLILLILRGIFIYFLSFIRKCRVTIFLFQIRNNFTLISKSNVTHRRAMRKWKWRRGWIMFDTKA